MNEFLILKYHLFLYRINFLSPNFYINNFTNFIILLSSVNEIKYKYLVIFFDLYSNSNITYGFSGFTILNVSYHLFLCFTELGIDYLHNSQLKFFQE
jgi:hypothetical protein